MLLWLRIAFSTRGTEDWVHLYRSRPRSVKSHRLLACSFPAAKGSEMELHGPRYQEKAKRREESERAVGMWRQLHAAGATVKKVVITAYAICGIAGTDR